MRRGILTIALFGLTVALMAPAKGQAAASTSPAPQDASSKPASAQDAPPKPEKALLKDALSASKKLHKPTLVMFHASWCGWCHRLEAVMDRPEFKKMFEDNYVLLNLDVLENGPKVASLENPGGKEYMAALGGEKSGLPYYAFLDAKGTKLADSNVMPKGANIGYPGEPGEIEAFMELIKKTAPHWSDADQKALHDYLVENAPKANAAH